MVLLVADIFSTPTLLSTYKFKNKLDEAARLV